MERVAAVAHALREMIEFAEDSTIRRVYLFGSQLADPTATSDVDIIVVREDGAELGMVSAVSTKMSAWFFQKTQMRLDQTRVTESELRESGFLATITWRLIWERS